MPRLTSIVVYVTLVIVALKHTSCVPTPAVQFSEEKIAALKEISKKIKNSVNEAVDPCMDYNEYICGHFDEDQIVSKSEIVTNEVFDNHELQEILANYLHKPEEMTKTELKMMNFLTSCNNKNSEDINKFIRNYNFPDAIGGWPAFSSGWDGSKFDLVAATAEFELIANSILLDVIFKEKNDKIVIKISPKKIYFSDDEDILREAVNSRKSLLEKYGVMSVDDVHEDIVLFEKEYSSAISFETSEEPLEIDFGNLKQKLPGFDWDRYFEIILEKKLSDDTSVVVNNMEGLKVLISKVQKMEPRVVANYFFFLFVRRMNVEFDSSDSCYDRLFLHFESVISKLVVENLYNDSFRAYLYDMIHSIVDTMKEYLPDLAGKTTEDIIERIRNFLENDYLPNLTEDRIAEVYAKIDVDSSDFYGNILKFYRHYMGFWLQALQGGKNIGMKIINRRMLSYIFIRSIYEYYRKPSPIVFDLIATPFLRKSLNILAPDKDYKDTVKECFRRQLNISQDIRYADLVSVKAVQVYIKSFDNWTKKYPQLIAAENEIFQEFGLTDRKLLFAIHVQSSCRYKDMNDQSYLRKLFFSALPNMEDFTDEYNCPLGSPMNPKSRCQIP